MAIEVLLAPICSSENISLFGLQNVSFLSGLDWKAVPYLTADVS